MVFSSLTKPLRNLSTEESALMDVSIWMITNLIQFSNGVPSKAHLLMLGLLTNSRITAQQIGEIVQKNSKESF